MRRKREMIGHLIASAKRQCLTKKQPKKKKKTPTAWEYPETWEGPAVNKSNRRTVCAEYLRHIYNI